MYVGKRVVYDHEKKETVLVDDPANAQRTHHGDIQPAAMRIQAYKHKAFGKKFSEAVDAVRQKDHELTVMKKSKDAHGLMTA